MREHSIRQLPEYVSAIRKNGKFLRIQKDGAAESGQLFEQEITGDSVGLWCTVFRINNFSYDHEKDTLTLGATISFPETCKRITLQADLLDEETEQVITSLEEKVAENSTQLKYEFTDMSVDVNSKLNRAVVILYADWIDSSNIEGEAAILEDELMFGIRYEHIYPKKERDGYKTFGNDVSDTAMELAERYRETEGREESENIVISMFRKPDDTKDLDYLCLFGKIGDYPPVSVPAKGGMFSDNGNVKFICDEQHPTLAICTIAPYDTGGAVVAAVGVCNGGTYKTGDGEIQIDVSETSILYEMTKAWKIPFTESGDMNLHNFHYELAIYCRIRTDQTEGPYTFYVSSVTEKGGFYMEKIPDITMKWGCLAEGTQILMADGTLKAVQDIRIGERIKTDGGNAEVTNIWSGTQEGCIRVVADNGRELVMTKDHPVLTDSGWKRAGELTCSDVISTENGGAEIREIALVAETVRVFNPETGGKPVYANGFITGDFTRQNNCK